MITCEIADRIAYVGLNRSDKRNAINDELLECLRRAVAQASEQASAAVLFGHGPHFCAGLDLAEAVERARSCPNGVQKRKRHNWHEVFDLIARGPIPWVGALHGAVVGGGLELACATHLRVGDESAFFALPEAQRGIFVGGGGTVRIQRAIGFPVMADMMLTGRVLDAEEGRQEKILRYLVPNGESLAKAGELARAIANNPHETNWRVINVLPRINDLSHDDGLFMEYLTNAMPRPQESQDRLREFLGGKAKPLGSDSA